MLGNEGKIFSRINPIGPQSIKPYFEPSAEQHLGLRAPINKPRKVFVNKQSHRHPNENCQMYQQPVHHRPDHRPNHIRRPGYRHNFVADSNNAFFPSHPHQLNMGVPVRKKAPPWVKESHPRIRLQNPNRPNFSKHFRPMEGYNRGYPKKQVNHRQNQKCRSPHNLPEKPQEQQSYTVEGEQPIFEDADKVLREKVENLNFTIMELKNEHASEKATVVKLRDELATEKATVIKLKDELAQEKTQRSRTAQEKSKLEEDLGIRVSLAESEITSQEEKFRCKELKLVDELLLKGGEVENLKSKVKELEATVIETRTEAAKAKSHRDELAKNLKDYIQKTDCKYLEIESEKRNMDAIKQFHKDERGRFESERIDLQARIARLETDLNKMQHKMLVKEEQICEQKILSEKYTVSMAENSRLRDKIAAQKKRIHTQEFWVGKTDKLSAELNTWKAKCKATREETQQLNEQVCKLQIEKQELKKKAKTAKSQEKLLASVVTLETKSKEYFEKMLNAMGEVQELRERLSRATQQNNVLKTKLKLSEESVKNEKNVFEQEGMAETVEAALDSAGQARHEK